MAADPPAITLRPDPASWAERLRERPNPAQHHRSDRGAIGLPATGPIVMSGHQPVLWHAGTLAKLIAACELARSADATACWIVADMDEADPVTVRAPHGRGEQARVRTVRLLQGDPPGPGIPTAALKPREPAPADDALPGLTPLLAAHRAEPTLALQMGRAVVEHACDRLGLEPPTVIACSQLVETRAWHAILDAMRADPAACARAYNDAAGAHPDARVRPMQMHKDLVELPLWRVRPDLPRLAVFADQLGAIPPEELRPRALAMTALVRAALCELFIHGTGGGLYDRVTERWLASWDGAPAWTLAPTAVATADAFADLGMEAADLPDPARARWRAHHARHDPAMLGDDAGAAEKAELLAAIEHRKRAGDEPAPAFAALQQLLRRVRQTHAERLAALDADADRAERLRGVRDLALDRTWPWPYLPGPTIDALHEQIRGRLGTSTMQRCPPSSSPAS